MQQLAFGVQYLVGGRQVLETGRRCLPSGRLDLLTVVLGGQLLDADEHELAAGRRGLKYPLAVVWW